MDAVVSERLKDLVVYWIRLAENNNGRPSRETLDPAAIPHLLRHILLVDVEHDPLRFQHRLVGTKIAETVGRDTTGHTVDDKLYNQSAGSVTGVYAEVVNQRRPLHALGRVEFTKTTHSLAAEVVLLPLFEADAVRIIVVGVELDGQSMTSAGERPQGQPFEIHTDGPRPLRL